ncbi:gametocyte-specific factor 1-like isoform X2 [Falco peregrinus]|uniref:gametocyte-specific factor 1-like isoform X2 n=2 Tax=Falco TaxID=8952 RepID=UPI00247A9C3D|nr:gametocyte-specific factor 1-like isoform X2 [Falco peregrinus]
MAGDGAPRVGVAPATGNRQPPSGGRGRPRGGGGGASAAAPQAPRSAEPCCAMELEDDPDILDPERLIQCPYNKHHQIRACRFPYHLVKCRKSYPEVAKELATCPFNARHLVPQADLSDHMMKCNDKGFIEQDVVNQSFRFQSEQMNAVSTWQAPPCDEDWETESSEQSDSPFIWGTTSSGINSTTTSEQRNCLPARLRAPESFPYAVSWKG